MPFQRTLKNIVKNYSSVQCKVREATSNDPWGPTSHIMADLSDLTHDFNYFNEIMAMLWSRMSKRQTKHWRHVYKSLLVMEYLLKTGNDIVVTHCKQNAHRIEALLDFRPMLDNRDVGQNIRSKSRDVMQLLQDDNYLISERVKALKAKESLCETNGSTARGVASSRLNNTSSSKGTPLTFRRFLGTAKSPSTAGDAAHAFRSMRMTSNDVAKLQELKKMSKDTNFSGDLASVGGGGGGASSNLTTRPPYNPQFLSSSLHDSVALERPSTHELEDIQLQIALAISREEHEKEVQRKQADEELLRKALQDSSQTGPSVVVAEANALSNVSSSAGHSQFRPPPATAFSFSQNYAQPPPPTAAALSSSSVNPNGFLDLVDISLSAAPAGAPDPWGGGSGMPGLASPAGVTAPPPNHSGLAALFPPADQFLDGWEAKSPPNRDSTNPFRAPPPPPPPPHSSSNPFTETIHPTNPWYEASLPMAKSPFNPFL